MVNIKEEIDARYKGAFLEYDRMVMGAGRRDAEVMLIGEAPGAHEVETQTPFVGQAGKNLTAFLEEIRLGREALYITNAVKFRPTKAGKGGRLSNRTPTRAEVLKFVPWLHEEIAAIAPKIIVTLGNTALFAVTNEKRTIGELHGALFDCPLGRVFPLFHPAAIIYRRELVETYRQDVALLAKTIKGLRPPAA